MKKGLYYFFIILFASFVFMQLNDPDWFIWIWPYLIVCVSLYFSLKNKQIKYFNMGMISILGLWFLSYVPDLANWFKDGMPNLTSHMKAESMYIEMVRESLGLFICLTTFIFLKSKETRFNQ